MSGKRWIVLYSCLPIYQNSLLVDWAAHSFVMATESACTGLDLAGSKTIVQNLHTIYVNESRKCPKDVNMKKLEVTSAAIIVQSSHQ